MKFINLFLLASIVTTGLFASAQIVEPSPEMKYDERTLDAVDAILRAKKSDLDAFIKSGNTIKEATSQNVYPSSTVYTFTRQQCNQGGVAGGLCLGGSKLTVTLSYKQMGSMFRTEATSSLIRIK